MIVLVSKRLPPTRCGIGDYTRCLAAELAAVGTRVVGVAWERPAESPPEDPLFPVEYLPDPTAASLASAFAKYAASAQSPVKVILQTSQYDAHPRGLAGWLTEGIQLAQAQGTVGRWTLMMHEIWLPELARRRDFWIYPRQRFSFTALLRAADAVAVTTTTYARRIERLAPRVTPKVLPVFSTLAEPASEAALGASRQPGDWAVFGSTLRLRAGLSSLLDEPRTQNLRLSIAHLDVFGGDADAAVAAILARHPDLSPAYQPSIPAEWAGERLRKCHAAWIDYPESRDDPALLGKSTLLAAAMANGALPVLAHPATGFAVEGEAPPYWYSCENPPPAAASPAAHAARAANFAWYHRHASRKIHARWYAQALQGD
jgi:hypothetical protein